MWVFSQKEKTVDYAVENAIRNNNVDKINPSAIPPCSTWKSCLCHWGTGTGPWKLIHRGPVFLISSAMASRCLSFTSASSPCHSCSEFHMWSHVHCLIWSLPQPQAVLWSLFSRWANEALRWGLSQACSWREEGPGPAAVAPTHITLAGQISGGSELC